MKPAGPPARPAAGKPSQDQESMHPRILTVLLLAAGAGLAALALLPGSPRPGSLPEGRRPPSLPRRTPAASLQEPPPLFQAPPAHPRQGLQGTALQVLVLSKGRGRPLPGIRIRLLGRAPKGLSDQAPPLLAEGRTGPQGTSILEEVPPPPWTLEACGPDRALVRLDLAGPPPEGAPLEIRLSPGGALEGRIRDERTGDPLGGALVEATPARAGIPLLQAVTRPDGIFRLEGLALERSYRLRLSAPGYAPASPVRTFSAGDPFQEFSLAPLPRVRLVLLPPQGIPSPPLVRLQLLAAPLQGRGSFYPTGRPEEIQRPRGGRVFLPLPGPGLYRVRASTLPGAAPPLSGTSPVFRITESAPGAPGPSVDLPLTPSAVLEGRVLSLEDRRPLEGTLVWVRGRWEKARTGRDGRFRLPCPAGTSGTLVLRAPGDRAAFRPFHLPPRGGGTIPLGDLLLPRRAGRIQGVLRDSSGRPLEGKSLHLGGPGLDPWNWPVRTGPGGVFRLSGLPFGDWEIRLDGTTLERFGLSPSRPALHLDLRAPGDTP